MEHETGEGDEVQTRHRLGLDFFLVVFCAAVPARRPAAPPGQMRYMTVPTFHAVFGRFHTNPNNSTTAALVPDPLPLAIKGSLGAASGNPRS